MRILHVNNKYSVYGKRYTDEQVSETVSLWQETEAVKEDDYKGYKMYLSDFHQRTQLFMYF